jgi:hypothetical protein
MTARDRFIGAFTKAYLAHERGGRRVSARTIAGWLGLSESTVRKHLNEEFELSWRVTIAQSGQGQGWEWRPSVMHLTALLRAHSPSCPSELPVGGSS